MKGFHATILGSTLGTGRRDPRVRAGAGLHPGGPLVIVAGSAGAQLEVRKMIRKSCLAPTFSIALMLGCGAVLVAPAAHGQTAEGMLKMAVIEADSPAQLKKLTGMGLDIAAIRRGPVRSGPDGFPTPTFRVEAVLSSPDGQRLIGHGFSWHEPPGRGPTHKIGTPYDVYHSFDEPITGIRAALRRIAATYPRLTRIEHIGRTLEGRQLPAVRLTNESVRVPKPQVLFVATTHAREWISTEVAMRLIEYLVSNHGTDSRVTSLLDTTEVWIIPVVNPDGYQYTFTNERLWRKNLRDNDGDGQITLMDGVDLNRNYATRWGYDDEGSSPALSDATYRGAGPESEPETRALTDFIERNDFKFALSYHSYGNLILYPWGWQVKTPSNDDPIFVALAGTDGQAAIVDSILGEQYDPGVGADLYITNGEFTDWAYSEAGIPGFTVELTFGSDADGISNFYGFEFPDDEGMVQAVFEDNLEFALSLIESAHDPANPVSPVGIFLKDVYHTPVTDSNGPHQIIEAIARKGMPLTLSYSINGGSSQSATFSEKLGSIYNESSGRYYSRYEAIISGQQTGDMVSYEISGGASMLPYMYSVTSATGNPILVVAAEDYSGPSPGYADNTQPNYLDYYTAALDAGGYEYDVWDVDQQGIPTYAEVLSHYETVIWYTGDDFAAFVPNGLDTQEAEVLNFRDFINYADGTLFATGQDLSWLSTAFGYYSDDFFQYYLGAYIDVDTGGIDPTTDTAHPVVGVPADPVFDALEFDLFDPDGADNQCCSSTFVTTSAILPQFDNTLAARYVREGGPFDPHSGDYFVFSQLADLSYKRLGGTFQIPAGSPTLSFWISYDIETDWDFAFVEINVAGSGVWTTLPDQNGLSSSNTGQSCLSGWVEQIHGFLANYMDADCNPTGATGEWHAFTGNSGGWQQVSIDLSAYAGQTVELHISYATDWSFQRLGVFVDDIELAGAPLEDFESGLGQWQVSTGPSGALNNWIRTTSTGITEGPAIRTPYSVYFGFGFEAVGLAEKREMLMDRVMQYLGQ